MLDSKDGFINRSNLYKGLALVAFAQQGKTISDKLLQNFTGQGALLSRWHEHE